MSTYVETRAQLETYFDRTASDAWARLTSDAPVGRIRSTVRAGRDDMRSTLLSFLPDDLRGARFLDAGCGTGALSVEAARRGAQVMAVDLSATLVELGTERCPTDLGEGSIEFRVGDFLDPALGRFDYAVAMDSFIHYRGPDMVSMVERLASQVDRQVLFTFAPRTPLLTMMHAAGKLFPRSDRSPAIVPIGAKRIQTAIQHSAELSDWTVGRTARVDSSFYISQALEITRS